MSLYWRRRCGTLPFPRPFFFSCSDVRTRFFFFLWLALPSMCSPCLFRVDVHDNVAVLQQCPPRDPSSFGDCSTDIKLMLPWSVVCALLSAVLCCAELAVVPHKFGFPKQISAFFLGALRAQSIPAAWNTTGQSITYPTLLMDSDAHPCLQPTGWRKTLPILLVIGQLRYRDTEKS